MCIEDREIARRPGEQFRVVHQLRRAKALLELLAILRVDDSVTVFCRRQHRESNIDRNLIDPTSEGLDSTARLRVQ